MIIVTQDKDNIVNLNNVVAIRINDFGTSSTWQRITAETSSTTETLGDYKTEKRAKEVLEEITERYTNWNNLVYGQPTGVCSPKYEMPKE